MYMEKTSKKYQVCEKKPLQENIYIVTQYKLPFHGRTRYSSETWYVGFVP